MVYTNIAGGIDVPSNARASIVLRGLVSRIMVWFMIMEGNSEVVSDGRGRW